MNKYLMFFFLALLVIAFGNVFANNNIILQGKIIYIDPGHGGIDPGAVYKDIKEEDINLEVSLKLKEILEKKGAIVLLTRSSDNDLSSPNASLRKRSDLYNRSKLINESNASLYLSIHLNAESSGIWKGAQTFYDKINPLNKELANSIQKQLISKTNTKRTIKEVNNGYLYKRVSIPGVLIEIGFLSNANERTLLRDSSYQYKICEAIASGVEKFIYNQG